MTEQTIRVLDFIIEYKEARGYGPLFREIADGLEINKAVVRTAIYKLTKRGYIRRVPGTSREIEVVWNNGRK